MDNMHNEVITHNDARIPFDAVYLYALRPQPLEAPHRPLPPLPPPRLPPPSPPRPCPLLHHRRPTPLPPRSLPRRPPTQPWSPASARVCMTATTIVTAMRARL